MLPSVIDGSKNTTPSRKEIKIDEFAHYFCEVNDRAQDIVNEGLGEPESALELFKQIE